MLQVMTDKWAKVGAGVVAAVLMTAQSIGCKGPMTSSDTTTETDEGVHQDDGTLVATDSCGCIDAYGGPSMGADTLRKLRDEGLNACFHTKDPELLAKDAACLPHVVGQYEGNGKDIAIYYRCSDVCPDYGRVSITFAGVKNAVECCAIGGVAVRDPAWGGYEACVPAEIAPEGSSVGDCAK